VVADRSVCAYDMARRMRVMESQLTKPRRSIAGLLVWRECWALTPLGKLLALGVIAAIILSSLRVAYPFLAVTDPAHGQVLVVEGWTPTYMIKEAASEFKRGSYRHLLVVKGVYDTDEKPAFGCDASGNVAMLLVRHGVPPQLVHGIYFSAAERDRTYHSALAVKRWLSEHRSMVDSIDVVTKGAHARRSRLLYEKVFEPGVKVGVIALRDRSFEPTHWWRSSEGIHEIPFQALAYLYARFLFSERASFTLTGEEFRGECSPVTARRADSEARARRTDP
jgi:hypothetical protein